MRLFCDHMLLGVAHWLRAAGHDTLCAEEAEPDRDVFHRALAEGRTLLTCDSDLLEFKEQGQRIIYLQGNQPEACAKELARVSSLSWMEAPLTRCLKCNAPLVPATAEQRKRVPEDIFEFTSEINQCAPCDRVFWKGSHADQMLKRLKALENIARAS